jgi:hypothetical protein
MQDKTDMIAAVFAEFNNYSAENGYYVDVYDDNIVYASDGKTGIVCGLDDVQSLIIPNDSDSALIMVTKEETVVLRPDGPEF